MMMTSSIQILPSSEPWGCPWRDSWFWWSPLISVSVGDTEGNGEFDGAEGQNGVVREHGHDHQDQQFRFFLLFSTFSGNNNHQLVFDPSICIKIHIGSPG